MASLSGLIGKLSLAAACGLINSGLAADNQQTDQTDIEDLDVGPNLLATLKSADRFEPIRTPDGKKPVVGLKDYLFDDNNTYKYDLVSFTDKDWGRIGVQGDYFADLYASYQMPLFWMYRQNTNWVIYNPNIFIEAGAEGSGTLYLSVIELTIKFKIMFAKLTPFDFQMAWDLDDKARVCYSLSYFWEVFDFEIGTEWHINECSFGLLGYLAKSLNFMQIDGGTNWKDCSYRRYTPLTPVFQATLLDSGDVAGDFVPWECNNYAELQTERTEVDENGNDLENPVGYDDLPQEEEEGEWTYDPQNVVAE